MLERDIVLLIGGHAHKGWKKVVVDRSIENGAWAFELAMTEQWGGGNVRPIRTGQSCQLKLGNELLITGYIRSSLPQHDKKSHGIQVTGLSKTADLIECSTTGKEFKKQSLMKIATALCAPFGISVIDKAKADKDFKHVRIDAGQPIYEFLEQLARSRAVRLVPTPEGNFEITRSGTKLIKTAMKLGVNIEFARGANDDTQRFSQYTVLGQESLFSGSAQSNASAKGIATDSRVKRHRPTVVQADAPMDLAGCKTRAEWMRNTQFGRSNSATILVPGWLAEKDGKSWMPNNLVQVDDSEIGVVGERLLVRSVMTVDDKGTTTENTVMPKAAFELTELPEPETSEVFG